MKKCNVCSKKRIKLRCITKKVHYFGEKKLHKIKILSIRKKDMDCFKICKQCNKPPIAYNFPFGKTLWLAEMYFHNDDYAIKRSKQKVRVPRHKFNVHGPVIRNFFGKNKHLYPNGSTNYIYKNRNEAIQSLKRHNNNLRGPQYLLYTRRGEVRK